MAAAAAAIDAAPELERPFLKLLLDLHGPCVKFPSKYNKGIGILTNFINIELPTYAAHLQEVKATLTADDAGPTNLARWIIVEKQFGELLAQSEIVFNNAGVGINKRHELFALMYKATVPIKDIISVLYLKEMKESTKLQEDLEKAKDELEDLQAQPGK
jgi:hypothetical protein